MTGGGRDEARDDIERYRRRGGAVGAGGARRPAPRHLHRGVQGAAGRVAERRRGGRGSLYTGHMGKNDCTIHHLYTDTPPVRRYTHNNAILPFTLLVLPNSNHRCVFCFSTSAYDGAAPRETVPDGRRPRGWHAASRAKKALFRAGCQHG